MATRLTTVVIDAAHPGALAHWWSEAIGWPITFVAPDEVVVEPAGNGQSYDVPALVFVPVDDPKTTKNRVHLDLASDSTDHQAELVARLVAAGAGHADVGQSDVPWVVLADPEGNEFCVLEPRDRHIGRGPIASIVVDAADPSTIARFWVAASGWPIAVERRRGGQPAQPPRAASRPRFRAGRRRQGGQEPGPPRRRAVRGRGPRSRRSLDSWRSAPTHIDVGQGSDVSWVVLADPEGNEFCVLQSPRHPTRNNSRAQMFGES